jgi:hypothetical protein
MALQFVGPNIAPHSKAEQGWQFSALSFVGKQTAAKDFTVNPPARGQ